MKFNRLEGVFFERILNAELGVPVPAILEYEGDTFDVILVPELNEEGDFILRYYNAPTYEPETQFSEASVGTKTWTDRQVFGLNPSLERVAERWYVNRTNEPIPIAI